MFSSNTSQVSADFNYVEDVFSTYLYTGSNSAQTITNGIDLAGKGGLVWLKGRSVGSAFGYGDHELFDSVNVSTTRSYLRSDGTDALGANGTISSTPFTSSGFNLTAGPQINNRAGDTSVSWTFRKQPKFFDIVTYTGNGASGRTIPHNLGSVPGCIIVKSTSSNTNWSVYHRNVPATDFIRLNLTDPAVNNPDIWNSTTPTSTVFTVGSNSNVNGAGATYVAYLFAHNAGGFGLTGTDNVISCGTFTTDGSGNATVDLGYEPQWVMIKQTNAAQNWYIEDNMRAFNLTSRAILFPNLGNAEATGASAYLAPSSTGFSAVNGQLSASATYIYIAIRRGPMKTPTLGTSVFSPVARTGTSAAATISGVGFAPDFAAIKARSTNSNNTWLDKLRGAVRLQSDTTNSEDNYLNGITSWNNDGISLGAAGHVNGSPETFINYLFRRAPGFFDEVCSAGVSGANTARTHNLGVIPELIIAKDRAGSSANWTVYSSIFGQNNYLNINTTAASATSSGIWGTSAYTSTTFYCNDTGNWCQTVGNNGLFYLFATCAGVSKVGSYTGNGSSQTIACGFAAGARFVMIKRTDSTGDWYVWDTARGIIAGNDPHLSLNSTAAEVTTDDTIDPDSSGFIVNQVAATNVNVSSATYIFLAIA